MTIKADNTDVLCDYCSNQPECDGNYQLCINFSPKPEIENNPKDNSSASDPEKN